MVKYDRLFHSKGRKKSCLSNGTIKSLNNNSPIDFSCESSDSLSNFGTGTARPSFALRQPISRPAISRANPDRTPGLAKTSALRAIVLPSRGSPNRSAALRLAYRTGGISLSSIFHSGEVPSEEVRRCARPNATGPLIETFSEEAILKKTKKNSSGGPPFVSVGHRAFHSIGGGDVPRHFRTISEKSRSFTFSQGIPKPGPITRPCEKTADSSFRRRSLGRHTLPAKITDRFPPERPVIFKANPRPRFPTSKNVNRRPHSGRGGNTRTLPVIRPCRRPRGESWERCPPDCCAPAPEYTTAHGRYPLRAAEPAACGRRCACGTSASV